MLLATVNEATMVPFVSQQLNNLDLALALAKRGNLPGAEGLVGQQFERLFQSGQYKEAAEAAAESPQVSQNILCWRTWRLTVTTLHICQGKKVDSLRGQLGRVGIEDNGELKGSFQYSCHGRCLLLRWRVLWTQCKKAARIGCLTCYGVRVCALRGRCNNEGKICLPPGLCIIPKGLCR